MSDPRREQLREWACNCLGIRELSIEPASADASFRRYFRLEHGGASWVAMDAPPEHENCEPFVHVAKLMRAAGVNVPEVHAWDVTRGFLLLTDLGRKTYLQALDEESADALFSDALDTLVRWQLATTPGELPPYDEALLRREMELLPDWYMTRHLDAPPTGEQRHVLDGTFAKLIAAAMAQPQVYVHRDYMPRNLMVTEPNPGVLDFQDAVYGPITYDVVSLFRDAFITWPEERVLDWTARYWGRAKRAGLPVNGDFATFYRDFEWMGLQRHIKVLGIFARLHYRDGKRGYIDDTPRFVEYVRSVAGRYSELRPFLDLVDSLHDTAPRAAYSF